MGFNKENEAPPQFQDKLEKLSENVQSDLKGPQAKGWASAAPHNYDALAADTQEKIESQKAAGNEILDWAFGAAKYEWSDEFGEIGPRDEQLEQQLFQSNYTNVAGEFIQAYKEFEINQEGPVRIKHIDKFEDAGLHPAMMDNIMLCKYERPTPIQAYCIPAILQGHDLIGVAQTGTGKTTAYLAPILSKLMGKAKLLAAPRRKGKQGMELERTPAEPLVVILCPSRELAIQVFDEARRLAYRTMLRPCAIYGGGPVRDQINELSKGCDILIATPGRLRDLMSRPQTLRMDRLKFTVLDEADEMLKSDWEEELKEILVSGTNAMDGDHQFMMFSATFPKEARSLARQYLTDDYVRVRVGRSGSAHGNVRQQIVWTEENLKQQALYDLLLASPPCRTMVFVNSIRKCDMLDDYLFNLDFPCTSLHSQRTQREREDAIHAFRTGRAPILVTTGLAARGIDIKNVMHIINFDLPDTAHGGIVEYVHRIGRTARIGNKGQASSFYNDRNIDLSESLVKILLETKQDVPDFLQSYAPPGGEITWDDDTDDEHPEDEPSGVKIASAEGDTWNSSAGQVNDAANGWGDSTDNKTSGWGVESAATGWAKPKPEVDDSWGANATTGASGSW